MAHYHGLLSIGCGPLWGIVAASGLILWATRLSRYISIRHRALSSVPAIGLDVPRTDN